VQLAITFGIQTPSLQTDKDILSSKSKCSASHI